MSYRICAAPSRGPAGSGHRSSLLYLISGGLSMKKLTFLVAAAMTFLFVFSPVTAYAAYEPDFDIRSQAVYLENLDTGLVVYEKNADKKMYPASLTKVMTAIITLEYMEENQLDLDTETASLKLYLQDMIYGTGSSLGGILQNEEVTIRGLLYAALLQSAGEAALMLADYVGDGSVTHFVEMMNEKAAQLGCTGTHFANPHGLHDPENYSTARDMALICKYAMQNPTFAEIVSTTSKDIGPTNKHDSLVETSTNRMLFSSSEYYYAPAQGIKTGTLPESGRCLASQATSGGYSYLVIILGAPQTEADGSPTSPEFLNFYEARKLFQWAFENFQVRTVVDRGEELAEVKVKYSFKTDHMMLATDGQCTTLMPGDLDLSNVQYIYDVPQVLAAPVEKGQTVGTLRLMLADEEIGSVPLVTTDSVEASKLLTFFGWFGNAIHTFQVKFVLILAVLLIILYSVLMVHANKRRRRKGKYSSYRSGGKNQNHYL